MNRVDFTFDSGDGSTKIHAVRWEPEGNAPTAILQIVHGMAEHVDRYEDFANFLTNNNIAVTAEDHLGHGKSIPEGGTPGFFCAKDSAGIVVGDVQKLRTITSELYPNVPYFVLGHSMGSFILRNFLFTYGTGLAGAIVMGTGMQPKALVSALKFMAATGCFFGKAKKPCKFINNASFGTYLKKIDNPRTANDWLTKDAEIVDKYNADPLCGFTFPGNGFKTLGELLSRLYVPANLEKMPKDLRILVTSGDMDPVGDYGEAPKKVYESYKALGIKDVSLKLYKDDRHEILNESDKQQVYEDILGWIKA